MTPIIKAQRGWIMQPTDSQFVLIQKSCERQKNKLENEVKNQLTSVKDLKTTELEIKELNCIVDSIRMSLKVLGTKPILVDNK